MGGKQSEPMERLSLLYASAPETIRTKLDDLLHPLVTRIEMALDQEAVREPLDVVPLFSQRADRSETAIAFFKRTYAGLLETQRFFADDLRRHDQRLYSTLSVYQAERGLRISDLIPTRPKVLSAKLNTSGERRRRAS